MHHFTVTKNLGTLKPYTRGLRYRLPSWFALITAIPLLTISFLSVQIKSILFAYIFGISGLLFFTLWFFDQKAVKNANLLCIDNKSKSVEFINGDGYKNLVNFGDFTSIKIEKMNIQNGYIWRATLLGTDNAIVLETGFTKKQLVKWIRPVSNWLQIPIEISDEIIDGLSWAVTANRKINPYPGKNIR